MDALYRGLELPARRGSVAEKKRALENTQGPANVGGDDSDDIAIRMEAEIEDFEA